VAAQVVYAVGHEMAATVDDVLARRIGLELWGWREALSAAPATAALIGGELGWTPDEVTRAAAEYAAKPIFHER